MWEGPLGFLVLAEPHFALQNRKKPEATLASVLTHLNKFHPE
jgi:hypothetical protein